MSEHRVSAPILTAGVKAYGPPSYFPSIERKYGMPMQHWLDLAVERLDAGDTHMQVVAWLKAEHAMGHGHANAVVAYVREKLA